MSKTIMTKTALITDSIWDTLHVFNEFGDRLLYCIPKDANLDFMGQLPLIHQFLVSNGFTHVLDCVCIDEGEDAVQEPIEAWYTRVSN